jgi:hypothetical protein
MKVDYLMDIVVIMKNINEVGLLVELVLEERCKMGFELTHVGEFGR